MVRPIPFPLQRLQLRHRRRPFSFDGEHNNEHLQLSFDDKFSDVDDYAEQFAGRWQNLYTIHVRTQTTVTIQNMFTHDTQTLHGTMTHQYCTHRRNHRMPFTHEIPVRYRSQGC